MPSPFPGMDPYLEGDLWTAVHSQFAADIVRLLMRKIAPRYVALLNKRYVVDAPGETTLPESVPHLWVEMRDPAKRNLVTAIEFLSPSNKRGEGREEYLTKRSHLLRSTTHLLEIDLLRKGRRVPMQVPLPSAPYVVFLSRAGKRPRTEVWPIGLDHPLPTVPVPLGKGDPDIPLDLQLVLTSGYDLLIDYTKPPEIPLPPEAAAWADERLRAAGLRP